MSIHNVTAQNKSSIGVLFLIAGAVFLVHFRLLRSTGILLAAFAVISITHLLSVAVIGQLLGARLKEFGLFYGRTLFALDWHDAKIVVKTIPIGGFVSFYGMDVDSEEEPGFRRLPALTRAVIIASGPFAAFLLSCALVGNHDAIALFGSGFKQVILGAFAPRSYGKHCIGRLLALSTSARFSGIVGTLAAKVAAFNLLPIPTLAGGQSVMELLQSKRPLTTNKVYRLNLLGLSTQAFILLGWIVAGYSFVISGVRK